MKLLHYAENANRVWQSLPKQTQNDLQRNFHLRPTNSGVTIVSTLIHAPMRGLQKIIDADDLAAKLMLIHSKINELSNSGEVIVQDIMKSIGFKNRQKAAAASLEEKWQALMIGNMSDDRALQLKLKAKNRIRFIASEFIFERGKYKVDIVGFDGNDLFLFELKRKRTTKVDQVKKYVDYYSMRDKNDILKNILKIYPINPVMNFNKIRGVMVMESNTKSRTDWDKIEIENSINIVFFNEDGNVV